MSKRSASRQSYLVSRSSFFWIFRSIICPSWPPYSLSGLSDERIDVLSNCYTNVKFLNNKYHPEIMEILAKYDPDVESVMKSRHSIAHWKTPLAEKEQTP